MEINPHGAFASASTQPCLRRGGPSCAPVPPTAVIWHGSLPPRQIQNRRQVCFRHRRRSARISSGIVGASAAAAIGFIVATADKASRRRPPSATVSASASVSATESPPTLSPTEQQEEEVLPDTLRDAAEYVMRQLRERKSQVHDQIHDHELPVKIPKRVWTHLGTLVKVQEEFFGELPDDCWISLRLDGCAWGTLLGRLVASGVLKKGFNDGIAESMQATLRAVMSEFGGVLGYSHSDEFTLLVPPARHRNGSGPAGSAGFALEWVGVAASVAAGVFNKRLSMMAADKNLQLEDAIMAHFDCRIGVFDTVEEALGLILWRVNDCHVNSASDAIKFSDALPRVITWGTIDKLLYMQENKILPLRRHQAYGSLIAEVKDDSGDRRFVLMNSGAGNLPKHVLNLAKLGSLLPCGMPGDSVLTMLPDPLPDGVVWRRDEPTCACRLQRET